MKHLSDNNFNNNQLNNVPNGVNDNQAVNLGQLKSIDTSSATIKHYRHTLGFAYDVIDIKNPQLTSLTKRYAPGVDSTGATNKVNAREYSRDTGYRFVLNADGFVNSDGTAGWDNTNVRAVGLQIADNTLYGTWDQHLVSDYFIEAVVMMPDGKLTPAYKDDGITGTQWVNMGALWSVCWGRFVVLDGEIRNTGAWSNEITSRPILGQKANGDLIIIMIEGKTGSYGATPAQAASLALSLGCEIAYIMDGGGSQQAWWNNSYAVPSSDHGWAFLEERGVVSFLTIETNTTQEIYDSGMIKINPKTGYTPMDGANVAIGLRQVGPIMHGFIRTSGTFNTGNTTVTTDTIPRRYFASIDAVARFGVSGGAGRPMTAFWSGGRILTVANLSGTSNTYAVGNGTWDAPFTDIDAMLPASGSYQP